MCKFFVPLTGAALLLALGGALLANDRAPGLTHGAAALRAAADSAADPAAAAASHDAARRRLAAPGRAPFLLSPFGHVPPPAPESLPADAGVRTRSGAYLTRDEADALAGEMRGDVVWVDVGCCGASDIERAQGHVAGMLAADNLTDDAPVFVSGADLAAAAQLVDRLSAQRLTRVFLVTR